MDTTALQAAAAWQMQKLTRDRGIKFFDDVNYSGLLTNSGADTETFILSEEQTMAQKDKNDEYKRKWTKSELAEKKVRGPKNGQSPLAEAGQNKYSTKAKPKWQARPKQGAARSSASGSARGKNGPRNVA